ncbi:MAG: FecR domain-containing protein, partial [Pseudomonadota bacterium]
MAVENPEFSDEVRKQALKWRVLIDNDELDGAERAEFEAWVKADPIHVQALDRAETVLSAFRTLDDRVIRPQYFKPSFGDHIREMTARIAKNPPGFSVGVSLAAACAAIFIVGAVIISQLRSTPPAVTAPIVTVHETGRGQIGTIVLADESELTLGPATRIEVTFTDSFRKVDLKKGAVVFDVTSDTGRPFTVEADAFSA